ncbi:hypothetical protein PVAP13_3KG274154 [Panicum virgatum]|uniref:Uncharacterized protein n=1 Tax=Panicum virgatum TaxID=38727 RepID=A0A8T0UWB1_PANVG|nr:hypothetical protein PVAP13_3KG274154 [Panicum virgatum]
MNFCLPLPCVCLPVALPHPRALHSSRAVSVREGALRHPFQFERVPSATRPPRSTVPRRRSPLCACLLPPLHAHPLSLALAPPPPPRPHGRLPMPRRRLTFSLALAPGRGPALNADGRGPARDASPRWPRTTPPPPAILLARIPHVRCPPRGHCPPHRRPLVAMRRLAALPPSRRGSPTLGVRGRRPPRRRPSPQQLATLISG